jgi:hypothetical protein
MNMLNRCCKQNDERGLSGVIRNGRMDSCRRDAYNTGANPYYPSPVNNVCHQGGVDEDQREVTVLFHIAFNITSPYPIIDSIIKSQSYSGDTITVTGGNWNKNTILVPSMTTAVMEFPGLTEKLAPLPVQVGVPPVPILYQPDYTLVGSFLVKVPQMYCGKTQAIQDALSKATGKFYFYGLLGPSFASNSVDIQVPKRPISGQNPYHLILGPNYNSSAPNRTVYYTGTSLFTVLDCQKAIITQVKNSSSSIIKLSNKATSGGPFISNVNLPPYATTTAFNGLDANTSWEALGPESGSMVNQNPLISIDISWK